MVGSDLPFLRRSAGPPLLPATAPSTPIPLLPNFSMTEFMTQIVSKHPSRNSPPSPRTSRASSAAPPGLILERVPGAFGISRLDPDARIPRWVHESAFFSVSRSAEELSVLCEERLVPDGVRCERGWSAVKVAGTLDLSLIGVLASLARPLAASNIGLFTVSTFDTDYLLVRRSKLEEAIEVLEAAGHRFDGRPVEEPAPQADEPEDEPASSPGAEAAELDAGERLDAALDDGERLDAALDAAEAAAGPTAGEDDDEPDDDGERLDAALDAAATAAGLTAGEDDEDDEARDADAGARAKGLFTGAIPQHPVEITDESFEDLGLSAPILETVREVGFEHPTPIQARVIPVALDGLDAVGLAETGSGKTAAFCLPMAERLTHGRGTRGLILCPTREIALQTKAFLDIFGRDHELETVSVIGGVRMGPQIDGFRRDADILVATPGRLADHMRRGNVKMDLIEWLVLDEADHMLDLGFLPQIKEILEHVPDERQTLMFSATMPPPIERLAQIFMKNPVRCDIRPEGQLAAGIEHRLYLVRDEDMRKDCLFALLREVEGSTLIFVRRKLHTEWLARQIELAGFEVARIHSDRSQSQRVQALRSFRQGKVRILVATDVAARGIDVPLIQHVINFGPPEQVEDYVHRAGRTARGSAAGIVSTIGTWQDKLMVRDIELDLGIEMPRCTAEGVEPYVELPKRKTVRRRRLL